MTNPMLTRPIPKTGEPVPVIGVGTWPAFDVGRNPKARARLAEVLRLLFDAGGSVIDSSPMYGRAEGVVGDLLAEMGMHDRAFLATKVWTAGRDAGIAEMEDSFRRFRADHIELMQVHNLVDWRTQLKTIQAWKDQGRFRYIGITHYTAAAHDDLADVLEAEDIDFVQMPYSIRDRAAERRLLPVAEARGVGVIPNKPLGGAGLLRAVRGRALPGWAGELGIESWAQFFLKFLLAHPAVTCIIPGTGNPAHMADALAAGSGPLPDAKTREEMARLVGDL
jgi:aryl-alcohol dehydrogenase-like predicted oxidoreductase